MAVSDVASGATVTSPRWRLEMDALIERCAAIDVGQATVVVCALIGPAGEKPRKEVRTYRTMTRELGLMREWLLSEGVTHVAMESTGVYWKPVHALIEDAFEMIVCNAQHVKNVGGRKTDVKDAEWLAELLRHGLLRKSFVPPPPIRALRDLLRYRRKLTETRTSERNRLLKLLETANIKLASVASDVFGVSGMLMLKALLAAKSSPQEMAGLAKGRLREKKADLELALEGRMNEHHRFLLQIQLRRLEQVDADIARLDAQIDEDLKPYQAALALLMQIPGVDRVLAATIIAEIGVDMSVFKSERHLSAWAGVCPGNNESAGKRKKERVRKGNIHLQTALVEAANAAARTKTGYLRDKFYRLKTRRGHKRAAMAIARKILVTAYHMLSKGTGYKDLGDAYLDRLDEKHVVNNLVRRLERLGYTVDLKDKAA